MIKFWQIKICSLLFWWSPFVRRDSCFIVACRFECLLNREAKMRKEHCSIWRQTFMIEVKTFHSFCLVSWTFNISFHIFVSKIATNLLWNFATCCIWHAACGPTFRNFNRQLQKLDNVFPKWFKRTYIDVYGKTVQALR